VGTIVFVLVLIPTATASLEALAIPAISDPAIEMLQLIVLALPGIFTAIVIVGVGIVIAGFTGRLVGRILAGIGLDRVVESMGFPAAAGEQQPSSAEQPPTSSHRTPSEILGIVTQIGITLFAIFTATNVLGMPALTAVVSDLLLLFGRVISGVAVLAVGVYLGNLARQLILSSGGRNAGLVAQAARIAILTFAGAMALQQIGLAPNLVMLAFGLLFGSIAVAVALAYGLGGQQVAAEQLRDWKKRFFET
jgi:hypothetical protein